MRWTIRLECGGSNESTVVGHIDRQGPLQAGTFGISLIESKQILSGLQQAVVQRQFTTAQARHRVQQRISELSPSTDMTVFSDGDDGLRDLVPQAAHVLGWFHLTRYLTIIKQIVLGREGLQQFPTLIHDRLDTWLTSMKWRLWHGRVNGALERLRSMRLILQRGAVTRKPVVARLRCHLDTLQSYLENNAALIPNYAQRYRRGERISTAFVESAVNQLIDKRMSKSQQMRWSPRGAHALLQVRAEAVDQRLRGDFARWYPGFAANDDSMRLAV